MSLTVSVRTLLLFFLRHEVVVLAVAQHPLYLRVAVFATFHGNTACLRKTILSVLLGKCKDGTHGTEYLRRILLVLLYELQVLIYVIVYLGSLLELSLDVLFIAAMMTRELVGFLCRVLIWSIVTLL